MGTSRTGTARWKALRVKALRGAQEQGLTQCPLCRTDLDYMRGRLPNSAEVDHILPHSLGGTDTIDNVRVICRRCNQSRGNKMHIAPKNTEAAPTTTTLVEW